MSYVTVRISQEAQVEEAKAGRDARAERTLAFGQEHVARALSLGARIDDAGVVSLIYTPRWPSEGLPLPRAPRDANDALDLIAGEFARQVRAKKEEREGQRQRSVQRAEELRGYALERLAKIRAGVDCNKFLSTDDRARLTPEEASEWDTLVKAEQDQKAEAERVARDRDLEWIAKHGSVLLKGLAREGLDYTDRLTDEKLDLDRAELSRLFPGWALEADVCGIFDETVRPSSVTVNDLETLEQARAAFPKARLAWRKRGPHVAGCSCETDDDDGSKINKTGVWVIAVWNGHEVVLEPTTK